MYHTLGCGGDNMNIGFVGAGKVGFSLGKYFCNNDIKVSGYYSQNLESSKEAAKFTKSKRVILFLLLLQILLLVVYGE